MLAFMPTLGIRFDIGKVNSAAYGIACWRIFWEAIDPRNLPATLLFEGDTKGTLNGQENVFCIALQSMDRSAVESVRTALEHHDGFQKVAAWPPFGEDMAVVNEPLPDAGRIDAFGELVGTATNSRPALEAAKKQNLDRAAEKGSLAKA
ncbi:MAG: hypothetical protein PHX83_04100 [Acidobacteriia bacterium]|nr:hypothetical protein [Terriglobia bacterium]